MFPRGAKSGDRSPPPPSDSTLSHQISIDSVPIPPTLHRSEGGEQGTPPVASAEVGSGPAQFVGQVVAGEYAYARMGLPLGPACIIGGVVLGLNGVAGSTSWTASVLGLESNINDAAPGVVLFIVGVFFVWITKPKVKIGEVR